VTSRCEPSLNDAVTVIWESVHAAVPVCVADGDGVLDAAGGVVAVEGVVALVDGAGVVEAAGAAAVDARVIRCSSFAAPRTRTSRTASTRIRRTQ